MSGLGVALSGALLFSGLAVMNRRIGGSWLYPAAAMTGAWAVVFVALCFASAWLYPIPVEALGIYVVGAGFFSLGSYVVWQRRKPIRAPATETNTSKEGNRSDFWLLLLLLLGLVAGFPLYFHHIQSLASAPPLTPRFFLQVRMGLLNEAATLPRAPIVENLVVVSSIAALIGFAVTDAARRWKILVYTLLFLAAAYNLLTASKVGLVSLVLELMAVYVLRRGRLPIAPALAGAATLLVGFGVITVLRVEVLSGHALSFGGAVSVTLRTFFNYLVASVVGFGVYLQHPSWVPAVWSIWRPFERLVNYFGHYFQVPDLNAMYVLIGPGLNYNTYTAYFAYYPHYGVLGVAMITLFLGMVGAVVYRKARQGGLLAILFYGTLFYGFCMTIFNESLFMGVNFIAKLLVAGTIFVVARRVFHPGLSRSSIAAVRLWHS